MTSEIQAGRTDRRSFIKTLGAAAVALGAERVPALARPATPVRFGVDMFSVNAQKWTPFQ